MKGGRMKPENLRHRTIHIKHLSDVPVSRNWYNCVKIIPKRIYIRFCMRVVYYTDYIQQKRNQYENYYYIPQEPENLRFASVIIFFFAFLIDIFDNIITFSLYSPYYVTRTSINGSAVSLPRVSLCIRRPVYCTAIVWSFSVKFMSWR